MSFSALTTLTHLTLNSQPQKILAMFVGANLFMKSDEEYFVAFNIDREPVKELTDVVKVKIHLSVMDLYDLTLYMHDKTERTITDIYAEDLKNVFEKETNLLLSF